MTENRVPKEAEMRDLIEAADNTTEYLSDFKDKIVLMMKERGFIAPDLIEEAIKEWSAAVKACISNTRSAAAERLIGLLLEERKATQWIREKS